MNAYLLISLSIYLGLGILILVLLKIFIFDDNLFVHEEDSPFLKFFVYLSIVLAWPSLIIDVGEHLANKRKR